MDLGVSENGPINGHFNRDNDEDPLGLGAHGVPCFQTAHVAMWFPEPHPQIQQTQHMIWLMLWSQ